MFRVSKGSTGVSITDAIVVDNVNYDLTGCTAEFSLRAEQSSDLKLDHGSATITDVATGEVRYVYQATDVDTAGLYFGWWTITLPDNKTFDTAEFGILIEDHQPGAIALQGAVADRARQHMPVTWDRLSKDERYGNRMLQSRVDNVKFRLFGVVVAADDEETEYDFLVLDYLGKRVALDLIPAAIEYWSDQHQSLTATGTNETISFPNRLLALERLREWLITELRAMQQDVEAVIPFVLRRRGKYPAVDTTDPLITPNPANIGRPFIDPRIPGNMFIPFVSE